MTAPQEPPTDPADPFAAPTPIRQTDKNRWSAAWERFGSEDQASGTPAEPPLAATPPADTAPTAPAATAAPAAPAGWNQQPEWVDDQPWDVTASPVTPQAWGAPLPQAAPQAPPDYARPQVPNPAGATAADLASATLIRPREQVPTRGWRRALVKMSGGTVNPGPSAAETHHGQLVARIGTPVRGRHRIAVVSLKGGIGKTTTTACLGLTLAHYRGDRVVAIDANPDAGTLAERLTGDVTVTVQNLLDALPTISSYTDVSAFTHLADRLQVVASEQDPEMSHAFDEQQYRAVVGVLERYFNLIVTDSGTGLLHSAMAGTLALADSLVVVGAPSIDGSTRAAKTLDWLVAHGYHDLVARSVAVISSVRPSSRDLDLDPVRHHFAGRCRAVVEIPYDPHLVLGGRITTRDLRGPTAEAFLELAAAVADGFALHH